MTSCPSRAVRGEGSERGGRHPPAHLRGHAFQVSAQRDQHAVLGRVELVGELEQVGFERLAPGGADSGKRPHDRAVVVAEDVEPVPGRAIAEDEVLLLRDDRHAQPEQRLEMRRGVPERRQISFRRT